jgi:CPA1 family monovalent cation:H+ antiporter
LGLSWPAAIGFGALISATDPVAVIAFFRSLGVSKRLALLVEGESLLNDAMALVLYVIAVSAIGGENAVTFASSVGQFLTISIGGLAVGIMLGSGVSYLILKNVNDHLIETVTTITLAFGSYVIAEELHVSGILAVVTAGLFVGNVGFHNTSPTTQIAMNNFWEMLAFIANSLIFLVIGLEIHIIEAVQKSWLAILIAVAAVLFSRVVVVYSLTAFNKLINPKRDIPMPFRHIMFWGGMRGAISLALALTLTGSTFGAAVDEQIRFMTFGVVLFTLLAQGLTIKHLINHLGLSEVIPHEHEHNLTLGALYAKMEGQRELSRLHRYGLLDNEVWQEMNEVYETEIKTKRQALQQLLKNHPELKDEMMESATVDTLKAERSAIREAARLGLISEEAAESLIQDVDGQSLKLDPDL